MVNERYEEEGHEEGEYHFSDDQASYDMESDATVKNAEAAAVLSKTSMADKLKKHRRMVVAIVVFIILLGIVYKLVTPSTQPVTDFQQGTTAATAAPVNPLPKKIETLPEPQKTTVVTTTATLPAQVTQSVQPVQQPAQPAQPVQPAQSIQPAVQSTQPAPGVSQPMAAAPQQPVVAESSVTTTTTMAPPASPESAMQNDKNMKDRLATVEQQNSAIMNLMQTQYAQKIADTELQNTQLRTQVQELTARISNMEVAFRQLTKLLRNAGPGASTVSSREPVARVTQPGTKYMVQAIIPGRAWLKSDSGETVTVAEGDLLKGYGRITKIDPYDGVVDIDTGTRVISLAYGLSGD